MPHFDNPNPKQLAVLHYLVYRSIDLHSADIRPAFSFDAGPRSGRLTANTFFYYQ
jgi:hypothetical protein